NFFTRSFISHTELWLSEKTIAFILQLLFKKSDHFSEGFASVAYRIFFFGSELGACHSCGREKEYGVISETAFACGCLCDIALHGILYRENSSVGECGCNGAYESC